MSYLRVEFHVFHPSPSPESGKGFLAAGFLLRRNRAIRLLPVRDFCSGYSAPSPVILLHQSARPPATRRGYSGPLHYPAETQALSRTAQVTRSRGCCAPRYGRLHSVGGPIRDESSPTSRTVY